MNHREEIEFICEDGLRVISVTRTQRDLFHLLSDRRLHLDSEISVALFGTDKVELTRNTLKMHVSNLRKQLRENGIPRDIVRLRAAGYRPGFAGGYRLVVAYDVC